MRKVSADNDLVCFCPYTNGATLYMAMFGSPDVLLPTFDKAIDYCEFSESFRFSRFRYWVRPFESSEGLDLLHEAEHSKNIPLLLQALTMAVKNIKENQAVITGLAAAELIAAANGNPSKEYSPHNDINRRIRNWLNKQSGINSEIVIYAKDVVAIIYEHSGFEHEYFVSDAARVLWRKSIMDLHSRLRG